MTKAQVKKIILDKTPIVRIIEMKDYGNCWQVVGEVGGDVLTYRVYSNGDIFVR